MEYSPIWSENKHELFSGLFLSKRITQTWRRGALPIPVSPVYQCIFPSCCRGRTTDAGSIICPSPKDARPLWEPGWPPSSHSSHLNAFTAPGADCDGSFPRKSARNSRPAPLGALRPFLILKSKSGRPVSLNPILEPRLRYHLEQTLQGCKLLIPDGVPTSRSSRLFVPTPKSRTPLAQWPPTASGTPTRANGTKPTSHYAAQKAVAGFLGHGRDDVTNLYFMSRPRQTVKRQEMILSSLLFSLMFSI